MQWELVATWLGLLITIGTGVFFMGKQSQKIDSQQVQIDELKQDLRAQAEMPVKLATLETDIKYLIREFTDIKAYLIRKAEEKS